MTEMQPLTPAKVTVFKGRRPVKAVGPLKTAIVLPDIQAGFRRDIRTGALDPLHDRRALDIALQIIEHVKPDSVELLGDNLDLPDWSMKFLHGPEFHLTTQPAVVELAWWLGCIRAIDMAMPMHYIEGNHEWRMVTLMMAHMMQAYDLRAADRMGDAPVLSVESLLGLKGLNIEYLGHYPHGQLWLNGGLRLHHGEVVRAKSGGTVRAVVDHIQHSEGQGHIHRLELATRTAWTKNGPQIYQAFSPGTLCRITPGTVPGSVSRQNWQQGIAVIQYDPDGDAAHINLVLIQDGKAIFDNRVWTARDEAEIVADIEASCGYKVA